MNKRHLDMMLNLYVSRFEKLGDEKKKAESIRWRAVDCFRKNWQPDAEDFAAMFEQAFAGARELNDRSLLQPFEGVSMLLTHPEEVAAVKDALLLPAREDQGKLELRQTRMITAACQINQRIAAYDPDWKYPLKQNHMLFLLALMKPAENYFYRSTDASGWANCVEFGQDLGSGRTFSLPYYYQMCNELCDILGKIDFIPALDEAHMPRAERHFDDQLHLLTYDLIYCCQAHHFYREAEIPKLTVKARLRKAVLQERIDSLEILLAGKRFQYEKLGDKSFSGDVVGRKVSHTKYGEGLVTGLDGDKLTASFADGERKFKYPHAFVSGFLTLDDGEYMEGFRENAEQVRTRDQLLKEIKNLVSELDGLKKEISQ